MAARRTRVEREWLDLLETSYADLFERARVDSEANAELIGEGVAFAWVAWYKAQAKPTRRRNLILLLEHLRVPDHVGAQLLRRPGACVTERGNPVNRKLEAFILAGIVLVPPPVVASITVWNVLGSAWPVDLIGGFLVAGLWPWGLWALARWWPALPLPAVSKTWLLVWWNLFLVLAGTWIALWLSRLFPPWILH